MDSKHSNFLGVPKLKNVAASSAQFRSLKKLPVTNLGDDSSSVKGGMKLEKVIGLSSKGYNGVEVNPVTGDLIYIAGSFLVVFNPTTSKQVHFLCSTTSKPFNCCTFSRDRQYLAAGESSFKSPQITIWEITYEDL